MDQYNSPERRDKSTSNEALSMQRWAPDSPQPNPRACSSIAPSVLDRVENLVNLRRGACVTREAVWEIE